MSGALDAAKAGARRGLPTPVYGLYRRARVRRMIRGYKPREVEHRYGRTRLRVRLEDALAEGWYDHDWDDPLEVRGVLQAGLPQGGTVFDIGAHQCVIALMLAERVGSAGRVIAVEASPHNARVGSLNAALNDELPLEVVHAAIAEQPGTVRFVPELNGHVADAATAGWGSVEVPALTLDGLAELHGPPDVVMLDIEGFELAALRGAGAMLEVQRPTFAIELHVGCGLEQAGGSAPVVLDLLDAHGYDVLAARDEPGAAFRPLGEAPGVVQARCFLLATPSERR